MHQNVLVLALICWCNLLWYFIM